MALFSKGNMTYWPYLLGTYELMNIPGGAKKKLNKTFSNNSGCFAVIIWLLFNSQDALWHWYRTQRFVIVVYFKMASQRDNRVKVSSPFILIIYIRQFLSTNTKMNCGPLNAKKCLCCKHTDLSHMKHFYHIWKTPVCVNLTQELVWNKLIKGKIMRRLRDSNGRHLARKYNPVTTRPQATFHTSVLVSY